MLGEAGFATQSTIIPIFRLMSRDFHSLLLGYNEAMKSTFEERYAKLNSEQKRAVDAIDGPVMVVAGPGTGKTQILTLRIANIIAKTDTSPENILALTFTDSGVNAMRKRLAEMIGSGAYRVGIYTFHSFANEVIKNNPEDFARIIGAESITEVDQIAIIEDIVVASELPLLKPFGDSFYYVRTILQKISDLKREGVSPKEYKKIIDQEEKVFEQDDSKYHDKGKYAGKMKSVYADQEKMIKKNRELAYIYERYQEELEARKMYDFNDMIVELLNALRHKEDLLLRLQEKHQYILVDEHQDTNNAQNKILELLANFHDNPNLFVVGDEKQSIYRFQGASLENFFYFKHLYPTAELVTLKHNYRSTQSILDSAHSLIPGETALLAETSVPSKPISLVSFDSKQQEIVWVAEEIERMIQDGVSAEEIAILYRNNAHAFPLLEILAKKGIQAVVESDQNLFEDEDIVQLLDLARAVQYPDENEALTRLLFGSALSLDPLVVTKLVRSASQKRKKLLIEMMTDEKLLKEEGFSDENRTRIVELGKNILNWKHTAENTNLVEMLEVVMRETGFLNYLLAKDRGVERVETIGVLFDEARSLVLTREGAKLKEFLEYIDRLKTHSITIKKRTGRVREGAVRLMTAHRSKGLEFDYVFITGVNDGTWGNQKKRELLPLLSQVFSLFETVPGEDKTASDDTMEERRLFYVALTRARKHVTLSYALQREDGKEILPSQFIGEIKEELVSFVDTEKFVHSWPEKQIILFNKRIRESVSDDEYKEQMKAFVREKLLSQGLSVSALNNYLKSPWLFFFRNLVRIPSAMNKSLVFGNAVHGALQTFFNSARGEQYPSCEHLIASFKVSLESQDYNEKDFDDLLKKGEGVLRRWYEEYQGSWNLDVRTEFRVSGVSLPEESGQELPLLTGVLDKLEFNDSSRTHVTVVDYKTGKPKTEGEVRGTTKSSHGEYYRQLVFYKLLLKYYQGGALVMDKGVLEFVESDEKGGFRRYEFEINDQEVEELEQEIRRVVAEILSLSFWDEPISEEAEEYRSLVDALKR